MAQIEYSPVQQALCRVRELSADEEAQRLAFVRERAERDERSAMRSAREEGLREGEARGEARGMATGEARGRLMGESAILERLLERRFGPLSDETRGRIASANAEQLEHWADRLLNAADIEAVFSAV